MAQWFSADCDESADLVTVVMATKLRLVSIVIEWCPVIAPQKVTKVKLKRSQRRNRNSRRIIGTGQTVLVDEFSLWLKRPFQNDHPKKCIICRVGKVPQAE